MAGAESPDGKGKSKKELLEQYTYFVTTDDVLVNGGIWDAVDFEHMPSEKALRGTTLKIIKFTSFADMFDKDDDIMVPPAALREAGDFIESGAQEAPDGGWKKITPEFMDKISPAIREAQKTREGHVLDLITEERARWIRVLRVEKRFSWRAVARAASKEWGFVENSDQPMGSLICEAAARMLGEDGQAKPWN